jgi:carboxymethylenebutenolidase
MRAMRDARVGRREFLRHLLAAGAGGGTGLTVAGALWGWPGIAALGAAKPSPPPPPGFPPDKRSASGITVPADDPAISAGPVEYPGVITRLLGYLSVPKGGENYPGILVLHDVQGLDEHVRDVTRRLAKVGYAALALDMLSRTGGTAAVGDPAKVPAALGRLSIPQFAQDLNSSVKYLESQPLAAKTRTGALGLGLGGNLAWLLLAQNPDVKAGVILYGGIPPTSALSRLTAAVLAIFAEQGQDASDISDLDSAMKKIGVPWSYKIEPKASRGFFDDMRERYVPAAAKDAWQMAMDWYAKHLSA